MKNPALLRSVIYLLLAFIVSYSLITSVSAQNVGIGTSTPTSKLHVFGGNLKLEYASNPFIYINSLTTNGLAGIRFQQNGNNRGWLYYDDLTDVLHMNTSSDGNRTDFTISSTGNIGIGTSNPNEKLHVEGTIEVDQKIQANDAGGLEFATSDGVARMVMDNDGYIGIGSINPLTKLHVYGGDFTLQSADPFVYLNTTVSYGDAGFALQQTGTTRTWLKYDDASDVFKLSRASAGDRNDLTVTAAGKVGLGTDSPGSHQLYVTSSGSGASGSTGFFVNTYYTGIALNVENASTSSNDNALLVTNRGLGNIARFDSYHGDNTWDDEFIFDNDGDGYCDGSWHSGGGDYAEIFTKAVESEDMQPGDVIAMSPVKGYTVVKADASKNQLVLGVYSTNPCIVGNSPAGEEQANGIVVGLMGVVPTKVCTDNGPIRIGDFVTASSIEGVAAKAISSGMVIGRAMENYNGASTGIIKVMVDVSWVAIDNAGEGPSF